MSTGILVDRNRNFEDFMRNLRMIGITVLMTMTWIGASVGDAMFSECRSLGGVPMYL